MMVKICGITNLEDAQTAVEAGASALGFNFYPRSPRAIGTKAAKEITSTVPPGILKVGIFVNEPPETIKNVMSEAGLDIAQVIGEGSPAARVWKVYRVDEDFSPGQLDGSTVEAFLLDTPSASQYGGTGHTFPWSRARIAGKRIVIAGGLGPDNVAAAIQESRPWGVDACSRLERSPGRKDPAKVRAFITAAFSL